MERISLKHKNQSKWIKRMLQRGGTDGETQKAIAEQLNIGDELRKKVSQPPGNGIVGCISAGV